MPKKGFHDWLSKILQCESLQECFLPDLIDQEIKFCIERYSDHLKMMNFRSQACRNRFFFSSKVTGRLGSLDLLEIPTGRVDCGEYDMISYMTSYGVIPYVICYDIISYEII